LIKPLNEKDKPDRGLRAPLNIFLYQEIQRMAKIIAIVKRSLVDMRDAIEGTIIMSPMLAKGIDCIYNATIPPNWLTEPSGAEISWKNSSVGKWMEQFMERFRQESEWMEKGKLTEYRLDTMFNPQGFLTSVKQEITRSHKHEKWSLDEMIQEVFVKAAKAGDKNMPDEGVFLKGLTVEGARFNNTGMLDELTNRIYDECPPIMISFKKGNPDANQKDKNYDDTQSVPCYQ